DLIVGRIDNDNVEILAEENIRIARAAVGVGRAESDPTRATVGGFEQPSPWLGGITGKLGTFATTGTGVDDAGVNRVDRYCSRLTDTERRSVIEDRSPVEPAIPRMPHAAPRRADVNDLCVVRIYRDRGDLTVDIDIRLEGARTNRCPDGSVEAHE